MATKPSAVRARPGDWIAGSFALYGRARWLTTLGGDERTEGQDATGLPEIGVAAMSATLRWMGPPGAVSGTITSIDRAEGTLTLTEGR